MSSLITRVRKLQIAQTIEKGTRLDGRGLMDVREIKIEQGLIQKAEGSARVLLGKTRVLVGVKIEEGEVKIKQGYTPLPLKSRPITVTLGKINDKLIVDPWLEEEQVMDARISMAVNDEGNICAIQKGGSGYFTPQQIVEASKIVQEKAAELRKKLGW